MHVQARTVSQCTVLSRRTVCTALISAHLFGHCPPLYINTHLTLLIDHFAFVCSQISQDGGRNREDGPPLNFTLGGDNEDAQLLLDYFFNTLSKESALLCPVMSALTVTPWTIPAANTAELVAPGRKAAPPPRPPPILPLSSTTVTSLTKCRAPVSSSDSLTS